MLAAGIKEETEAKMSMMKAAQDNAAAAAKNTIDFAKTQAEPVRSVQSHRTEPTFSFDTPSGQVIVGFGGKPAPAPAPQPEL